MDSKLREKTHNMSIKHRLQLDFAEDSLKELDQLKDVTGLPNRAEVIRQALRLLQWTIQETEVKGSTLLLEKNGKQREVVFPFMSTAGAGK
jgi:metal-responsive CopG/Arc/MetJ family transcriptional regulator